MSVLQSRVERREYWGTEPTGKSQSGGWRVLVSLWGHLNTHHWNKSSTLWGQWEDFLEHAGQHPFDRSTFLSFRMSVSDFRQNFEMMEVCHLTEAFQGSSKQPWSCFMHHGNWVPSITAGGPPIGSKRHNTVTKASVYEQHVFNIFRKHEYSACAN